jgi:acyl carrier protein
MDEKLKQVFCSVVRVNPDLVDESLSPKTAAKWDSLQHLNLVATLEESFGVKFSVKEMTQMFSSYGALRSVVLGKVQGG